MKAVKLIAPILMACAILFMSFSVRAVCPVQKTSIFYINGADNERQEAILSTDRLRQALKRKVNPECVTVALAYNQTQEGITDILEAFRQESLEEILTPTNFWEMFERLVPARPAFSNLMSAAVLANPINLLDTEILRQINEHLDTLYRVSPHKDNQLLFVGHSAGNYFANEERLAMTETERNRTKIVSVATLANNVAGASGPYTTVFEDGYVSSFAGALVPNLNNVGECTDDWACHGWLSSYMVPGSNSRAQILSDIIAALPTAPVLPPGTVFSQLDSSETILGWDGTNRRMSFQNLNSVPGTLHTIELRLKSTKGTQIGCNYSTRVSVGTWDGMNPLDVAPEQNISSAYSSYIFDFSFANLPIAFAGLPDERGLHWLFIYAVIPENPCSDWESFVPDVAGVNHDVSPYVVPRGVGASAMNADPYIVVTGR